MGSIGPILPQQGPSPSADAGTPTGAPPPPAKSRRGRKQNDSLPPSRSRDVQRAFRARRAERLAYLEARVVELEAENADLRARLGLPEPIRPPAPPASGTRAKSSPAVAPSPSSTSSGPMTPALPLPLPSLPRHGGSPTWMSSPQQPVYLPHPMQPTPHCQGGPALPLTSRAPDSGHSTASVSESCDISDDDPEASRLVDFCTVRDSPRDGCAR
jgi:hypothetical protein